MAKAPYPLSKTKFRVEITGLEDIGGWFKVKGIRFGVQTTPVYSQHTETPTFLPGKRFAGPITLWRMFDDNQALAQWAGRGAEEPKTGSIIYLDYTGEEARRYNFEGAYVIAYELSEFDARDGNDGFAEEMVVLTVQNIRPA